MVNFVNWFFDQFPYSFRERDTYKDVSGEGLLQRFLKANGQELDSIVPSIPGLLDLNNPSIVSTSLLPHLAEVLGNPPDTFGDEAKYRKLLKYLTLINKHKGTKKSYELLFGVLGVYVVVTELALPDYRYDADYLYDDLNQYDGNCPPCSNYTLAISDPDDNCPEIGQALSDPELYKLLIQIIKYVEPINARLTGITYNGTSQTKTWVLETGIWADQNYWDDERFYRDEP